MASEIKVDTISENTSAAGVTIDGVLIKDGKVDGVDVSNTGLVLIDSHDFSAATSVTRDNVFSSTYKTYLWECVIDSASATGYTDFNYGYNSLVFIDNVNIPNRIKGGFASYGANWSED